MVLDEKTRQKIATTRALIRNPRILIIDEFSQLDKVSGKSRCTIHSMQCSLLYSQFTWREYANHFKIHLNTMNTELVFIMFSMFESPYT